MPDFGMGVNLEVNSLPVDSTEIELIAQLRELNDLIRRLEALRRFIEDNKENVPPENN